MKACPYCAEEIQDAAIACKHCGRGLTAAARNQVVTVRQADWVSTTAKWGVGILLGGFVLIMLFGALFGEMP